MKSALGWQRPRSLNSPQQAALRSDLSAAPSWLATLKQWLVRDPSELPAFTVWYKCDAVGKLWWGAYDPVTKRSIDRLSESELRVWIEQSHRSFSSYGSPQAFGK